MSSNVDVGLSSGVREDILEAHFSKGELRIIGVRPKIFQAMQTLPKTTESFTQICLLALRAASSIRIDTPIMNASGE